MGAASKKRRAEKRKAAKKQMKAAKKALYASYAGTGRRRKKQPRAGSGVKKSGHEGSSNCGNVGCKRCFPQFTITPQNKKPPMRRCA